MTTPEAGTDTFYFTKSDNVSLCAGSASGVCRKTDARGITTTYTSILIIATIVTAILSVFFGHLWMAKLRGQLVTNILDLEASELVWPERLQYVFFLVSLIWSGMLVVEREMAKPEKPPEIVTPEDSPVL